MDRSAKLEDTKKVKSKSKNVWNASMKVAEHIPTLDPFKLESQNDNEDDSPQKD